MRIKKEHLKKVVLFCKQEKEAQCLTTGELTLRFRRHRKAPGSALGSRERSAECSWGKESLLWRRMEFHLPAVTGRSVRDEKRRGVRVGSEKEFVFPFCPPSLF